MSEFARLSAVVYSRWSESSHFQSRVRAHHHKRGCSSVCLWRTFPPWKLLDFARCWPCAKAMLPNMFLRACSVNIPNPGVSGLLNCCRTLGGGGLSIVGHRRKTWKSALRGFPPEFSFLILKCRWQLDSPSFCHWLHTFHAVRFPFLPSTRGKWLVS